MTRMIGLLKWVLRTAIAAVAILFVMALGIVLFVGLTPVGGRVAAERISAMVSTPERRIDFSAPEGLLSGDLRIARLTLSDATGPYAEIDGIEVDWSPAALVGGVFRAEHVSAASVNLIRPPDPQKNTTTSKSAATGASPPVAIRVAEIDLPEIHLAQSVSGRDFSLSLKGAIDATGPDIDIDLTVTRKDEPDARASAAVVFAPAENRLTLRAALSEPENGLLAHLLHLPGAPAIDLALNGEGPLSDWTGKLAGSVAGSPVIAVSARHSQAGTDRYRIEVDGGGQFATLLPPALRPLLAGTTGIDIAALYTPAGRVEIERGELASGAARVSAKGVWDPKGDNNLVAGLEGLSAPVELRWPLGGEEARLAFERVNFTLTGAASSARFNATAALSSVETAQGRLSQLRLQAESEDLDLTTRSGSIRSRVSIGQTEFANADLNRVIRGPFTFDAPLRLALPAIGLDAATFDSPELNGTLSGAFDTDRQTVTGNFRIFANPSALPDALAAKFDGKISAEGYINASGADRAKLENFILRSNGLEAHGNLLFEKGGLNARFAGRLLELKRWLTEAEGAAGFDITTRGPLNAPQVKAVINSARAQLAGRSLRDMSFVLDGTADRNAPSGTLRLKGSLDGQPIKVDASLASAGGVTRAPAIAAEIGPNRLTGALNFSADFLPEGEIDFAFPDLSLLAALAAQRAEGDLSGKVVLGNAGGKASAAIRATGTVLRRDAVAIDRPEIDLALPDLATLAARGKLGAARIGTAAFAIDNVAIDLDHASRRTGFSIAARHDGAPLAARGDIETGTQTSIGLESFSAAPRNIPIRLAAPTRIALAEGGARLNDLTIAAGTGSVTLNGIAGTTLDLTAAIKTLPASLINAVVPAIDAAGRISGEIRATGTPSAPAISYDLEWNDAALRQTRDAGIAAFDIAASGKFAGDRLTLDSRLTGAGGLTVSGGGALSLAGAGGLDMKFSGRLPFAILAGQLASQGFALEGSGNFDLAIAGSPTAPAITGTASASGARLIDVRRNIAVNELAATIAFTGDRATLSRLTGKLSSGGSVSASGTMGLGTGFPADLNINLDQAAYADGAIVAVTADGQLRLTGPLMSGPLLGGRITLRRAAITVPARLPSSLSSLDIRHHNAPPSVARQAQQMQPQQPTASNRPIRLDLRIAAVNGIFVRGRGIDAELGGSVAIAGTAVDPVVSGNFTMSRGRIVILTKRLDFSSGKVTFGGGLIPLLDMTATSSAGSTTITVTVAGVANDPTITFSSSPALPQDEVLARLIFGQSMSRLSPLQIAQLADGISQLAGGGGSSLLETLRGKLGVDDLDLNTDSAGQTTVSVGRRLNKRTYVQVEQGGETGAKATINLDIGRGVKLKAGAGTEGGNAGIFFEREY